MRRKRRGDLPLPERRVFVSRRRGPRSGWPVVIDWHIDGTDVTLLQREDAEALIRVIRRELHTIPADVQEGARALAREIERELRPVRTCGFRLENTPAAA